MSAPLPSLDTLRERAHVVSLPMRVRFRDVTCRELMLFDGPAGWGEFGPFPEYGPAEAATWLASAVEMAWQGPPEPLRDRVPVNATVPAVPPSEVAGILAAFPGCRTVKIKVAARGVSAAQSLDDDTARIAAVLTQLPGATIRCDANGAWTVPEAFAACTRIAETVAAGGGTLEYVEQPCASVPELAQLRAELQRAHEAGQLPLAVPIAADESIRRAADPLLVAHSGGADRAVVKAPPLGGPRRLLAVAHELAHLDMQVTVSSALDSAVGMGAGLAAAAALPGVDGAIPACGLGTGSFFAADVAEPPRIEDGALPVVIQQPEENRLAELAAAPDRRRWWEERLAACHAELAAQRD